MGVDVEEPGKERLEHGADWSGGLNLAGGLVKCVQRWQEFIAAISYL